MVRPAFLTRWAVLIADTDDAFPQLVGTHQIPRAVFGGSTFEGDALAVLATFLEPQVADPTVSVASVRPALSSLTTGDAFVTGDVHGFIAERRICHVNGNRRRIFLATAQE